MIIYDIGQLIPFLLQTLVISIATLMGHNMTLIRSRSMALASSDVMNYVWRERILDTSKITQYP